MDRLRGNVVSVFPKVVLTLLCRNEADIIEANIQFHLSCGVDFIIATDNASSDGTTDILRLYESRGLLRLLDEPELTHDQSVWVTRMANLAMREHAADWLIHSDADEFWFPSEGTFAMTLGTIPKHSSVLAASRTNFLPPLDNFGEGLPFFDRQTIREAWSLNSQGRPLPAKVCHRPLQCIQIDDGNHDVRCRGTLVEAVPTRKLEVLHFPVRSLDQLEKKIIQGAEALRRNVRIDSNVGATWLHLYKILQRESSLENYYRSICRSADQISEGLSNGSLVQDRRIQKQLMSVRQKCRSAKVL